mgnify:FL=1
MYGIPAGEDYEGAFATLEGLENVAVVCCDSTDVTVQQALRTA